MSLVIKTKGVENRYREFNGNADLGVKSTCIMFERPLRSNYIELLEKHGRNIADLVWDLMKVDGVTTIFINSYSVTVHIAEAFKWNPDIDQLVERAFYTALGMPKKTDKKVVVRSFPNREIREFNTDFEISRSDREQFRRPLRVSSFSYLRNVGLEKGGELVRLLFKIEGVSEVTIYPYMLRVEIGVAFVWTVVQDQIVDAIEKIFGNVTVSR